ncbi:MAG: tetratricopeptide repeat protein [Candidatus Anstonellales archaeon]
MDEIGISSQLLCLRFEKKEGGFVVDEAHASIIIVELENETLLIDPARKLFGTLTNKPGSEDFVSEISLYYADLIENGFALPKDNVLLLDTRDKVEATYYDQQGYLFLENGAYDRAIENYERARIMGEFGTLFNLGDAYYKAGRYKEAEEIFLESSKKWGKKEQVWERLGYVYVELGRLRDAEICFKRSLKINKDYIYAKVGLGKVLIAEAKYKEARELLEPLAKNYPKNGEAHMNLGLAYLGLNELDKAETEFKRAIELKEKYAEALTGLGRVYHRQKRYEEAEENYKKAIEADRFYVLAYMNLCELYEELAEQEKMAGRWWLASDLYNDAYSMLKQCTSIIGEKHAMYNELLNKMERIKESMKK